MEIATYCPECRSLARLEVDADEGGVREVSCVRCERSRSLDLAAVSEAGVERCALCAHPQLFRQRSFNRKLGLAIVVVSIVLAPYTLYVSLFVGAAVDGVIYLLVPWVAICYNCETEYRGLPSIEALPPFDHLTAQRLQARKERETSPGE